MNIISNDCVAGYIYTKQLKVQFVNPFAWSSMNLENFSKLIDGYDTLNFKNIECNLIINNSTVCELGSTIPQITIDNAVEVNYFHYQQSQKHNIPTKVYGYKYYNDMINYATDEYFKRLNRMQENPIFIWHITPNMWYNPQKQNPTEMFKKLNSHYTIIVFGANLKNKTENNIIMLNDAQRRTEIHKSGEYIYKNLLKDLKV